MDRILVAGVPRSGTTYMYDSLATSGPVLKTHGLRPPDGFGDPFEAQTRAHMEGGGLAIFLFGDPVLSVISTMSFLHRSTHYNTNCGYKKPQDTIHLPGADVLNYELMFDSWTREKSPEVLCVRYETLPEHHAEVEAFVGRDISWLPWKERKTKTQDVSRQDYWDILETYRSLRSKVNQAADIWGG